MDCGAARGNSHQGPIIPHGLSRPACTAPADVIEFDTPFTRVNIRAVAFVQRAYYSGWSAYRGVDGIPMQSGTGEFQKKFLQSLSDDASAEQVAHAAVAIWRDIDAALAPIIGQPGVAALLRRSQYLVRGQYAWLGSFEDDAPALPAFDALRCALAAQSAEESRLGNAALLQVFHDLLISLIGTSLCERLLRSVCASTPSGTAAQDPSR